MYLQGDEKPLTARVWAPDLASTHMGFKGKTVGVAFGCLLPALGSDPGLGN